MSNSEFRSTLTDLKKETHKIKGSDPGSAETIDQLINKLEEQLSAPQITGGVGLKEHMQSVIEQFESSHPRITLIVNDLMSKLASMGV